MIIKSECYIIIKEHRIKDLRCVERDAYTSMQEATAAIKRKAEAMYPKYVLEKLTYDTYTIKDIIMYYITKINIAEEEASNTTIAINHEYYTRCTPETQLSEQERIYYQDIYDKLYLAGYKDNTTRKYIIEMIIDMYMDGIRLTKLGVDYLMSLRSVSEIESLLMAYKKK